MELEERTLESAGDRCDECGARLTEQEQRTALESGGPNLCSVHAADVTPLDGDDPVDAGL